MRRAAFIAAALAALLAAPARAEEEVSLALPAHSLSFATSYIADAMGYWAKEGLKVKYPLLPGVGATNAVLSGDVQFANAAGPTLIRANARGQKLLGIGTTVERALLEIIMSKPAADAAGITAASPLEKKIQSLRGKVIAVDAINSMVHAYLRYVARKGGIDPEREITITAMQGGALLAGLKSGSVAGFTFSLPWTVIPVNDGSAVRLVSSPRGDLPELNPFVYLLILTKPEYCDRKPVVCRSFVGGLEQAFAYMHDHPRESLEIVRKRLPEMDEKVLAESLDLVRLSTPRSARIEEATLAKAQQFMIGTGMMTEAEKLSSFTDIYTNKFVGK